MGCFKLSFVDLVIEWFAVSFVHKHEKTWTCVFTWAQAGELKSLKLTGCCAAAIPKCIHIWEKLDDQKPQRVRKSSSDVPDKVKAL